MGNAQKLSAALLAAAVGLIAIVYTSFAQEAPAPAAPIPPSLLRHRRPRQCRRSCGIINRSPPSV